MSRPTHVQFDGNTAIAGDFPTVSMLDFIREYIDFHGMTTLAFKHADDHSDLIKYASNYGSVAGVGHEKQDVVVFDINTPLFFDDIAQAKNKANKYLIVIDSVNRGVDTVNDIIGFSCAYIASREFERANGDVFNVIIYQTDVKIVEINDSLVFVKRFDGAVAVWESLLGALLREGAPGVIPTPNIGHGYESRFVNGVDLYGRLPFERRIDDEPAVPGRLLQKKLLTVVFELLDAAIKSWVMIEDLSLKSFLVEDGEPVIVDYKNLCTLIDGLMMPRRGGIDGLVELLEYCGLDVGAWSIHFINGNFVNLHLLRDKCEQRLFNWSDE